MATTTDTAAWRTSSWSGDEGNCVEVTEIDNSQQ